MQYFNDMQSKYGFSDGDAIPGGVEAYRSVYIRVLNALLEVNSSTCRVVAWNRPGMHNWCLIVRATPEEYAALPPGVAENDTRGHISADTDEPAPDDAYDDAVALAHDMDIDSYVHVEVSIAEDALADLITNTLSVRTEEE